MESLKDKSSRSGSKSNLNESTLPLLDDQETIELKGDTPEKEKIELETRAGSETEKGDSEGKEKNGEDGEKTDGETDGGNSTSRKDKKKKKDKKDKEAKDKKDKPAKGHRRTLSCADTLTVGLNLLDRDEKHINDQVNLVFEDILAEPDSTQGFDGVWRLTYAVFSGTKQWVYRILSALLALPCGIAWGLIFSILTIVHVWVLSPLLRTLDIVFYVFRRVWGGLIHTILDPIFRSAGLLLSSVNVTKTTIHQEFTKEP